MFFFFKQKTAYELRISDWSSDVCSSDLNDRRAAPGRTGWEGMGFPTAAAIPAKPHPHPGLPLEGEGEKPDPARATPSPLRCAPCTVTRSPLSSPPSTRPRPRSEEHTSELQSLMRHSYAVFCLKTKNT